VAAHVLIAFLCGRVPRAARALCLRERASVVAPLVVYSLGLSRSMRPAGGEGF
jgi:hypothetical protein